MHLLSAKFLTTNYSKKKSEQVYPTLVVYNIRKSINKDSNPLSITIYLLFDFSLYTISNFVTSTDIDYVDDLTQPADTITSAQTLLHKQKDAAKDFGLYVNASINRAPH